MKKNVTVGQLVDTNDILCTIANLDVLQAVGEIYERDLRLVRSGLPALVTVEPFPRDPSRLW